MRKKQLKEKCLFSLPFQRAGLHNVRDGIASWKKGAWSLFHPHMKQRVQLETAHLFPGVQTQIITQNYINYNTVWPISSGFLLTNS